MDIEVHQEGQEQGGQVRERDQDESGALLSIDRRDSENNMKHMFSDGIGVLGALAPPSWPWNGVLGALAASSRP